jgi:hypothetical protein
MEVIILFTLLCTAYSQSTNYIQCDVVIAGGSTAAFAAGTLKINYIIFSAIKEYSHTVAYTSAKEGAKTCLLEPTDWVGYVLREIGC